MNIRNVVLILIGVMIIAFALAWATGAGTFTINGTEGSLEDINQTMEFAAADIQDIEIRTISTDANIIPTAGSAVEVHLYGEATEGVIADNVARLSGNRLIVDVEPKMTFGININTRLNLKLDVYVPADYANNLYVNTVSGRLDVEGLSLNNLEFNSVSGNLRGRPLNTKHLGVDTTSGSLDLNGFSGDIKANSVSGNIRV